MRRTKADTEETRKKIVATAAREFRRNGIHATGVSEIMAAVGLTHGGFYRHFGSKERLVAEACAASRTFVNRAEAAAELGDESLMAVFQGYLSREYHDNCDGGCAWVAMGSELARADIDVKRAASEGIHQLVDIIAKRDGRKDPALARADAMFKVSAMIGAVTVSRMMDDTAMGDFFLDVAKERLTFDPSSRPNDAQITQSK
jgi:TetR/AcrR family transcriptional regulator, transcriptional repressor for nem operon